MPRTAARFTQSDLTRAAKAMVAAGCVVTGVRIDREGNIEVLCQPQPQAEAARELPRSLAGWREQGQQHAR